ncbi:MAG: hypothetical protein RI985_696 [Chloroflexota bacterium]|jgi:hypothetical protein
MGLFELWSFFIIVIACAIAWVLTQQIQRIGRQQPEFGRLAVIVTICVWVWLGVALTASLIGFFRQPTQFGADDLLGFALFGSLMTIPVIGFWLGMRWNMTFRQMIAAIPTWWMVALQLYRIGGVVFVGFVVSGHVPYLWGMSTGIGDVLVGVMAVPVAWGLARCTAWAPRVAIGWNVLGLADIGNSVVYVFLVFFGVINVHPAPVLIGMHPLALIALFQVPLAIITHGVVLGRLIERLRR